MPTFAYKCNDCNTKYEMFHKVREIEEDVSCPACGSKSFLKRMSAANIAMMSHRAFSSPAPDCGLEGQCPDCCVN